MLKENIIATTQFETKETGRYLKVRKNIYVKELTFIAKNKSANFHCSGVYAIEDETTKTFYIGSTCNIQNRFDGHVRELIMGKHPVNVLQQLWNPNNFNFHILETTKSLTHQHQYREDYYVSKYINDNKCLNKVRPAFKFSVEIFMNLIETKQEVPIEFSNKKIFVFDYDLNFIGAYDSYLESQNATNIISERINALTSKTLVPRNLHRHKEGYYSIGLGYIWLRDTMITFKSL